MHMLLLDDQRDDLSIIDLYGLLSSGVELEALESRYQYQFLTVLFRVAL